MANLSRNQKGRLSDKELESLALPCEAREPLVVLSQAFTLYVRALEKATLSAKLSMWEWVALWALLVVGKDMTPRELSRILPIRTQSITSLLDRLQKRKLLSRRRSKVDRRKVDVSLTEEGEQLVRNLALAVREMDSHVVRDLSPEELRLLSSICRKIRNASVVWMGGNLDRIETTVECMVGITQRHGDESKYGGT